MLLRKLGGVAVSSALLLALAGCAPATVYPTPSPIALTACLITQTGSVADNGVNQGLEYALVHAEVLKGVRIHATSAPAWADPQLLSNKFHAMVARGCKMIFSVGSATSKVAADFAARHPDVLFTNYGGTLPSPVPRNFFLKHMDATSGAYLAGYLAAAQSKTKTIGTLAASNVDNAANLIAAFKQGAQRFADATNTVVTVLGAEGSDSKLWQITTSAANANGAVAIARQQVESGADVIAPFIGSDAAKFVADFDNVRGEGRTLLVGYGGDWSKLSAFNGHQGAILSSVAFDLKANLLATIVSSFNSDQIHQPAESSTNLGDSTVVLTPEAKVPWVGSVADTIAGIRDDIIAGRTVVYAANQ